MKVTIRGGLDEVGWGALAGPVISVVAVYSDEILGIFPTGVKDSKKTTESQRSALYLPLCSLALDIGIGHAWPEEMDRLGPGVALQLSYKRALDDLKIKPQLLIVDGSNRVKEWDGEQKVEPKADVRYLQVSAASIIAKYFRDTMMKDYAQARKAAGLPDYNWIENKGYGTPDHIEAIKQHGLLWDADDKTADHHLYMHRQRYCRKLQKGPT